MGFFHVCQWVHLSSCNHDDGAYSLMTNLIMSSHSDDESQIDDDVNMEKHEKQQTKYEQTTNNDAFIHIRR